MLGTFGIAATCGAAPHDSVRDVCLGFEDGTMDDCGTSDRHHTGSTRRNAPPVDAQGQTSPIDPAGRTRASRSEAQPARLFHGAPIGIGLIAHHLIQEANACLCTMVGCGRDELIGQSDRRLYPTDEAYQGAAAALSRVSAAGRTETIETRWQRKDGTRIDVLVDLAPLNPDDASEGIAFTVRDTTEYKQRQEHLGRERERMRKCLDLVEVMFIALDASGRVSLVNQKGCQILGYDEREILGMDWFANFVPEAMRRNVWEIFDKLLRGQIRIAEYAETPVLVRGHTQRLIAWHNTVLTDGTGAIVGTLSSGEDITSGPPTKRKPAPGARSDSGG